MVTEKSAQRKRFEEDTFPHLEALWRTAMWLTSHSSMAEILVLKTMIRASRSWSVPNSTVSSKARLFRILTWEFFKAGSRKRPPDRFPPVENRVTGVTLDDGRQYPRASIYCRDLLLMTRFSDESVKRVIAHLKPKSRLIMILLFREGFSYADIAYITGLRKDSVRSILDRLRRLILQYLVEYSNSFATSANNRISYLGPETLLDDGPCGG